MIKCEICGKEIPEKNKFNRLAQHIIKHHDITTKEYYDKYFLESINEKYCDSKNCNKLTNFINISKGYKQYCSNKCSSEDKEFFRKGQFDKINDFKKQGVIFIQNLLDNNHLDKIVYNKDLNGLKDEILETFGEEPFNKTKSIIPNFEIYKKILQRTAYLDTESRLTERLYQILNDLYSRPLCKNCGTKFCDFKNFKVGYYNFCSIKCSNSSEETEEKRKITTKKRYNGYDNPLKDPEFYREWQTRFFNKYGVYTPPELPDFDEKSKKTFQENYNGYSHPMKDPEFYKEWVNNFEHIHGVKTPSQLPDFNYKFVSKILTNHNVKHPSQIPEVKENNRLKEREKFIPYLYQRLQELNLELIDKEYKHAHYEHNWRCKICGTEFSCIWNHTYLENKCPTCNPKKKSVSKGELELQKFFKSLNIDFIPNSRQIIKPYELDIYLPKYKLAIEFDGLYWHSNEFVSPNYHKMKTDICNNKGIRLIHIFENEWASKQVIIKKKLKEILDKNNSTNIKFEDCTIKEIDNTLRDNFINKYDLKNNSKNSSLNIGCFYYNNLIYVMTFEEVGHGIFQLLNCSRNYKYSEIKTELLDYISSEYEVRRFVKTVDKKWNNIEEFKELGFNPKEEINPIPWLIHDSYTFIITSGNIENNYKSYSKIWDCGYIKLEKSLEQIKNDYS